MLLPNIMNVSYECSEFITAKSDKLPGSHQTLEETDEVCLHEIYHQSLQMGGLNILLDQVTIQSSTEWQQFQEEKSEDRSKWEEWKTSVW